MFPSKRCLKPYFVLVILLGVFCGRVARAAESFTLPHVMASLLGNYLSVIGTFVNPIAVEANLGVVLVEGVYAGAVGHYWLSSVTNGGDTLKLGYISAGAEVGWLQSRSRVFWLVTIGAFYPFQMQVRSTLSGIYKTPYKYAPFSFRGRVLIGVRFFPWLSLLLGGSYLSMDLGPLHTASGMFPTNPLDLSGIQLTAGLSFTL